MQILGLETSCDETAVAVCDTVSGLKAHSVFSQIDLHALYGGVVPELASRDHIRKIVPQIRSMLDSAAIALADIDGVAYTNGPGLAGALMTGAIFGRTLAWALSIPAIAVHHMEGHLLAPMLEPNPPQFPFVCLLVSGGHSMLVRVDAVGRYRLLGESIDDAAGEAFDKTAKMLGLPYPGGPHLARLAESGNAERFDLPRPMTDRAGLDFSFSGLKTAAITAYQRSDQSDRDRADLAASFQLAIIDTLRIKCQRALQQEQLTTLVVSGGVSANTQLRTSFAEHFSAQNIHVAYPRLAFCTDNAAMIALAGGYRLDAGMTTDLATPIQPRWPLDSLPELPPKLGAHASSAPEFGLST